MKKLSLLYLSVLVGCAGMSGPAGAIQSPSTPGPSVGHRPVVTGLVLGTGVGANNGDITDPKTFLKVGDTIGLISATGRDTDDDIIKAGAYCVWYKVAPATGAPVLLQDPGSADRNCQYTIQPSDAGFHLQTMVTLYSDQDIATVKGYTLNPIESIAADTLSATAVVAPYLKGLFIEGNPQGQTPFTFDKSDGFPTIGFEGATFKILIDDGTGKSINDQYVWSSSRKNEVSVNNIGEVTLDTKPSGDVTIEALPVNGRGAITYNIKLKYWFDIYTGPAGSSGGKQFDMWKNMCSSAGRNVIDRGLYTTAIIGGSPTRGIGTLWGEWGSGGKSQPYKTYYYQLIADTLISYNYTSGTLRKMSVTDSVGGACYDILP
ncbi:hypothetical protein LRN22_004168 [Salmonella enterica]|nr:hypothetical protein [Salmonella enterica]